MPTVQELITETTQELQDARAMCGGRRSPGVAPHPDEDAGLRVCINVPGLNRAASQELFCPSRMGCCEGPPHNYVCMPFGLPSAAIAFQHRMRDVLEAREARHQASWRRWRWILKSTSGPRAFRGSGPRWLMRNDFSSAHLLLPRHLFSNGTR